MHHALIFNVHIFHRRVPGAYRIATFLREEGWDVEVIDWANEWPGEEIKELCRSRITKDTVFCGFSCFFGYWPDHMEELSQWIKKTYPDVKLILGGSSTPRMKSTSIDYFIHGYGEKALLELISSIIGNTPGKGIKFDKSFGRKKVIRAIDDYPSFPMKKLMIKYEKRDFIDHKEWLGIEFSRGCKFKCLYCNFPVLGVKGDYTRDADDFYYQMRDAYDRWGVTGYVCADETFNDSTEKLIKFADAAEKLPFDPWFSGFIRADLLVSRPQDQEHLARLGFLGHFYGIETMNYQTAKVIGKGMHPDKLLSGLLEAKKYFLNNGQKRYRGEIALVLGLPHETEETIQKSLKWISDNWQDESHKIWPLEIPTDIKEDVLSGLSLNYEKYGYRKSSKRIKKEINLPREVTHVSKNMNWENDDLSLIRCKEIIDNWFNHSIKMKYNFRLTPWELDLYLSHGKNIDNVLNLTLQEIYPKILEKSWEIHNSRVKKYIKKKLNVKGKK